MTDPDTRLGAPPDRCPICEQPVTPGSRRCPACHQPLCAACGAAVGQYWTRCMACGADRVPECPECGGPIKARDRQCPHCRAPLLAASETRPRTPAPSAAGAGPPPGAPATSPACSVCGRQDETVRDTAFPFVVSAVLITFRRAFAGRWCARHRGLYWGLASLITSVAGWVGIPFGLIYTPLTLYKLARRGERPVPHNVRLLQEIAGHKLKAGDPQAAIRCLEEGLRLSDDEPARRRLAELYAEHGAPPAPAARARPWPMLAAIAAAVVLGLAVGALDYAVTRGLIAVMGEQTNLILGILSWTPWTAMLFLAGLGVGQLVEWGLRRSGCRLMALGTAFGLLAALVALYGALQGHAMGDYVTSVLAGRLQGSPAYVLSVGWLMLALGGGLYAADYIGAGGLPAAIFAAILAAAALHFCYAGVRSARGVVRWQQALAAVRAPGEPARLRSFQPGWLALAAAMLCGACSLVSLPLSGFLSAREDAAQVRELTGLMQEGKFDDALAGVQAFVAENPGLAVGHSSLGLAYQQHGEYDLAAQEFEAAARLKPDSGIHHALLANVCYLTDQPDRMAAELEQAERLATDAVTHQLLGGTYVLQREFRHAEEHYVKSLDLAPDSGLALIGLAGVCSSQGDYERALATCDRAEQANADAADVLVARGSVYLQQQDLDGARAAFRAAIAADPKDSSPHRAMSFAHFLSGDLEAAVQEAETALSLNAYDGAAWEELARACQALGETGRALEAAQEAVRLSPKRDTARYVLGLCRRDRGEHELAVREFEAFLALYWDRPLARGWKAEAEAYLAENP